MYTVPIDFFAAFQETSRLVAYMEKGRSDEEFIRAILRGTAYCDNFRECFPLLPGDVPVRGISEKQMSDMLKCFGGARVSHIYRPVGYRGQMPLVFSLDWFFMKGSDPRFHPKQLKNLERLHQRYQDWRERNAPPQLYQKGANLILDQVLSARRDAGRSCLSLTNEDDRDTFFKDEVTPLRASGKFNEVFAVLRASLVIVETKRGKNGNAWGLSEDGRMQERARIDGIGHWAGYQAGNEIQRLFFYVNAKRHESVDLFFKNFDLTAQRYFNEEGDAALRQYQQFVAGVTSKITTYQFMGSVTIAEYGRWLMHTRRQHPDKEVDGVSPRNLLMSAIEQNCLADRYSSKEDAATQYSVLARGYIEHGEPNRALDYIQNAKNLLGDEDRFRYRASAILQLEGNIYRRIYARTGAAVDRDSAVNALTRARNHFMTMGLKKEIVRTNKSLAALIR